MWPCSSRPSSIGSFVWWGEFLKELQVDVGGAKMTILALRAMTSIISPIMRLLNTTARGNH